MDIFVDFSVIYRFCNTNSCNLCYKTDVGGLCLLLGACKFLWRKHCNNTTCVLKRRVTASCRFQNYQKRLITFGFTTSNVKLFLRVQNSGTTCLPSQLPPPCSFRVRSSNHKLSISTKMPTSRSLEKLHV